MSNMSYCRFENTSHDLEDCAGALEELFQGEGKALSDSERRAAIALVKKCLDVVLLVADEGVLDLDLDALESQVGTIVTGANRAAEEFDAEERARDDAEVSS